MMALETAFPEYNPLLPPPSGVQARRVPGLLQLERRVQNQTQARISNANPNSYPYPDPNPNPDPIANLNSKYLTKSR